MDHSASLLADFFISVHPPLDIAESSFRQGPKIETVEEPNQPERNHESASVCVCAVVCVCVRVCVRACVRPW